MREIACTDCVVSSLLSMPSPETGEISPKTVAALELLSNAGILPPLRFEEGDSRVIRRLDKPATG
jgi:hypothetical protein